MFDYPVAEQCQTTGVWYLVFRNETEGAYRCEGPFESKAAADQCGVEIAWEEAYRSTGHA